MAIELCLNNLPVYTRTSIRRISKDINSFGEEQPLLKALRSIGIDEKSSRGPIERATALSRSTDDALIFKAVSNEAVSVLQVARFVDALDPDKLNSLFGNVFKFPLADASRISRVIELSNHTLRTFNLIRQNMAPNQTMTDLRPRSVFSMILNNPNLSTQKKAMFFSLMKSDMALALAEHLKGLDCSMQDTVLFGYAFNADNYAGISNRLNFGYISMEQLEGTFSDAMDVWNIMARASLIDAHGTFSFRASQAVSTSDLGIQTGMSDSSKQSLLTLFKNRIFIPTCEAAEALGKVKDIYLKRGLLSFQSRYHSMSDSTSAAIIDAMPEEEAINILVGMCNETLARFLHLTGSSEEDTERLLRFES